MAQEKLPVQQLDANLFKKLTEAIPFSKLVQLDEKNPEVPLTKPKTKLNSEMRE